MKTKFVLLGLAFIFLLISTCCDDAVIDLICPPSSEEDCLPKSKPIANQLIVELQPGYTQDMVLDSCNYDFFVYQLATEYLDIHPDSISSITTLRECNCSLMLLDVQVAESVDINDGKAGSSSPPEDQSDGSGGLIASVGMNFEINIGPVNTPYDTIALGTADPSCIVYNKNPDILSTQMNQVVEDGLSEVPCRGVLLHATSSPLNLNQLTIVAGIDTGSDPKHAYRKQGDNKILILNDIFYASGESSLSSNFEETNSFGGAISINDQDDDNNCVKDDLWGMDYFHGDNNPLDRKGHGTHITGTILSGRTTNNSGIRVMTLQIGGYENNIYTNENFRCDLFSILCGVDYAVDNGAHLINMSLGYYAPYYNVPFYRQIKKAVDSGILIVTSTGNDATNIDDCHHWPSNFVDSFPNQMIAVAALDTFTTGVKNYSLADFSNYGQTADIAAPGFMIKSAQAGTLDGEIYLSGTSMAAAVVSRRAAMIRDSVILGGGTITAAQIKIQILSQAAQRLNICVKNGKILTPESDPSLLNSIGYQ